MSQQSHVKCAYVGEKKKASLPDIVRKTTINDWRKCDKIIYLVWAHTTNCLVAVLKPAAPSFDSTELVDLFVDHWNSLLLIVNF